jgi:hypothetical protein
MQRRPPLRSWARQGASPCPGGVAELLADSRVASGRPMERVKGAELVLTIDPGWPLPVGLPAALVEIFRTALRARCSPLRSRGKGTGSPTSLAHFLAVTGLANAHSTTAAAVGN